MQTGIRIYRQLDRHSDNRSFRGSPILKTSTHKALILQSSELNDKDLGKDFLDHMKYVPRSHAISIEFNNIDINNIAGYEERTPRFIWFHLVI